MGNEEEASVETTIFLLVGEAFCYAAQLFHVLHEKWEVKSTKTISIIYRAKNFTQNSIYKVGLV